MSKLQNMLKISSCMIPNVIKLLLIYSLYFDQLYAQKSYKDFPEECYSAEPLDDESRSFGKIDTPTSKANDLELKKGWYRVLGKAGNSLKQGYEQPLRAGVDNPPFFCGTKQAGTLMGEHPTVDEGLVRLSVCFRDSFCFFNNVNSCKCSHKQTVYVRNCRGHYIYWLTPTTSDQRYCTGKTSLSGPNIIGGISQAVECKQHLMFDSAERIWDIVSDVGCDQDAFGWYKFDKSSGSEISSTCSISRNTVSRFGQACGAAFRGWMVDPHPTVEEGRARRRICFSYAGSCSCEFFSSISVRNCGNHYVYRLNGVPACKARYCGAANNTLAKDNDQSKPALIHHTDLCKANYRVLHDPDRLWSFTSPTVSKCDAQLYGVFRFGSKYTPWSIREGCNKTEMAIVTHRCGTRLQGFMEGKHPLEGDGFVERVICFQSADSPCECKFTTTVGVQKCGKHFVYQFKSVPKCDARYCMVANGSTSITIDPDRFPLYEIPPLGYQPVVAKQTNDDNGESGLVATTTVLSIIVLIVIILLILIIILLILVAWPIYKERRRRVKSEENLELSVNENTPMLDGKPSTSNGDIPKDDSTGDYEETPMPPYPSEPPPKDPPKANNASDDDSVIDMERGPGSDDDLKTIPEDTEHSDMNDEYDTLLKKEDMNKPKSYEHHDSVV